MAKDAPPRPRVELPLLEAPDALPGVRLLRETTALRGGWSHYEAVTDTGRRPVQASIVASVLAHDAEYAARFEATVAALHEHQPPAMPAMLAGGRCDRGLYLVCDPPPRRTLLDAVDGRRLSPQDVLKRVAPVATALDTLHAFGIVHAAVSPETIRVDAEGEGRLLHTGLADRRTIDVDLGPDWPPCVAPELLDGGPAEPAADVFGLAATLWRCFTGGYERDPVTDVPVGVLGALKRGLVSDPRLRTASAGELIDTVLLGVFGRGPG